MKQRRRQLALARMLANTGCLAAVSATLLAAPAIIPQPTLLTMAAGDARVTGSSTIYHADASAAGVAQLLADDVHRVFGVAPAVASGNNPAAGDMVLRLITDPALGGEGYRMTVTDTVVVEATGIDGLFAGSMSLLQSLTADGADLDVPQMTIEDEPFKSQRALMIDVKNQWHSIAELEKFVNLCRFYKVRHLSLHTGEEQWIGSVMNSTAGIPAGDRLSDRLYTKAEMDGLIAFAAARGVYLFPHNETTEGFSGMREALQHDFNTSDPYPNWVQEAYTEEGVDFSAGNPEGLDGFVDSDGNGVDDTDPDYWRAIGIFTVRSYAQFGAAYPGGKLPYYHMGPVQGEGGTSPDNAAVVLDILRAEDMDVKLMFWNGLNAGSGGDLDGREDETIVCFYSKQFSASDIHGYIDNGWPILNSAWSPLYIVGSSIARSQQQVHDDWNSFRTGTDGFTGSGFSYGAIDWDEFDPADYPAAESLLTGGMLCTWETPASVHLDRVRLRLPAMAEHAWHHKTWPYPAGDFADFRSRFLATDAMLPAFLGVTLSAPAEPENLSATNGDIANAIEISWRGSAGFPAGYRILRNDSDNLGGATQVAEVSVDESYLDDTVTVNTPYYYWVKAFNAAGESSLAGSVLGSAGDGIARTEAHEPFTYTAGQSIDDKDGGEGWNGGWSLDSSNGSIETVASSLSYGTLPTSGGALRINPTADTPSINISRELAEDIGAGGTTLWFSFLFRGDPRADGHAFIRFDGAPGIGKNWGSQFAFENNTSGIFMNSGETYFVVVRFDFGVTDDMYMWINPALDSEPAAGSHDHSTSGSVDVSDKFLINIQGYGHGDYRIDEIRLGPSWTYATGGDGPDPDDMDPPTPDPMTWISPPVLQGGSAAAMAATPAGDPSGVEYFFEETSNNPGGDDSGWQDESTYTDSGLQAGSTYTYKVRARDKSPQQNATEWSFSASVELTEPGEATPSSPETGGTGASLDSQLEWNPATGAASYDVYFGTTNPPGGGDFQGNQAGITFDPGPLSPNTTYYWRIDPVNAYGTTTGTTWSFTTGDAPAPGELLLHEDFEGYAFGSSLHGQPGQGIGETGNWDFFRGDGSMSIGVGLSGGQALHVNGEGADNDIWISHTVPAWGTGQLWMSCEMSFISYAGHAYVTGGESFSGAFGHDWSDDFSINNANGPGNLAYNNDQSYRLVVLIDWDNSDTILWVDPAAEPVTDPLDPEFAPTVYKDTEAQHTAQRVRIGAYGNTDFIVDDIRIGTDYQSVVGEIAGAGILITGFVLDGDSATMIFTGAPGVTDWRVMASAELVSFDIDKTATSVITEDSPGVYSAVVDLTGDPSPYFLRVER